MDMNIQKYMSFVKTVEYGSFTKAAQKLNYSQSGVSRMIGDLEKEWKIVLLERGKSGINLTSDGLKLLPYAKSLVDEYEKLQMQVDELNGLQSGLIRIGTFSSVATHWLPKIIKRFKEDYPNIDYELLLGDYSEIEEWVSDGTVDFGFLRLPTKPELETRFLAEDPLVAVIPENHPLAEAEKFPMSAFKNEPFIMLERGTDSDVADIFEKNKIDIDIRFTTWDDYAIMSMVENGLGISVLPQLILRRAPYKILTKPLDLPARRSIGIALKDKKTASVAVKRFLEYLDYRDSV